MHDVGSGHEEDLREVVLHVEVVIHEHEVLFGVEHFEQGRRRVAAEVHRHFVHFVQHEDRVLRPRFFHHLDNLTGQCPDVGAPVTANFGFIAHSTQRHADKLAAGGLRNRHAQRSLADARRADEAQD